MLEKLRFTARIIGADVLGYKPSEIGTHSLCPGAAMSMYLQRMPTYTIMLLGRWMSTAFLRYIRKQVQEFSMGVAQDMIMEEDFFHIPSADIMEKGKIGECATFNGLTAGAKPQFSLSH